MNPKRDLAPQERDAAPRKRSWDSAQASMALFGARLGRFLRVVSMVAVAGLATAGCGTDEGDAFLSASLRGPAGLSSAEWGARLFQDRGCTGCHQLGTAGEPSLASRVSETVERPQEDEPTEAVVVHDEEWATALLLEDTHGSADAQVRLMLETREARALAAFLATCR